MVACIRNVATALERRLPYAFSQFLRSGRNINADDVEQAVAPVVPMFLVTWLTGVIGGYSRLK